MLTLLLAEVALRVLDLPRTAQLFSFASGALAGRIADDPDLFWKLEPNHPDHNALGLRGPWFDASRQDSELRILAVGDSCTYGMGVPWSWSWGIQLERRLQSRMPDRLVRAGLAAVPGWSTFQNRRLLDRLLPDVRPELVVFYCGAWNDHVPAVQLPDAELAWERAKSRVGMMVRSLWAPSIESSLQAFTRGEAPLGRRVPSAEFRQNLRAMVAACSAVGAKAAFVVPTHAHGTAALHPMLEDYRRVVREIAAESRSVVVELEQLARTVDPERGSDRRIRGAFYDPCFLDRVHPGASIHEALARALADALYPQLENRKPEPEAPQSMPVLLSSSAGEVIVDSLVARTSTVHRAYLGEQAVEGMVAESGQFRWRLRADAAPGLHDLAVVTDRGLVVLGQVEVPQLPISARVQRQGDAVSIHIEGVGEPGRQVWCWLSAEELRPTLRTRYGDLGILLPDLPPPVGGWVRFDLAEGTRYSATVAPDGRWQVEARFAGATEQALVGVLVQALVFDLGSWSGSLTGVASITR